jgi:predicted ferric reductase
MEHMDIVVDQREECLHIKALVFAHSSHKKEPKSSKSTKNANLAFKLIIPLNGDHVHGSVFLCGKIKMATSMTKYTHKSTINRVERFIAHFSFAT